MIIAIIHSLDSVSAHIFPAKQFALRHGGKAVVVHKEREELGDVSDARMLDHCVAKAHRFATHSPTSTGIVLTCWSRERLQRALVASGLTQANRPWADTQIRVYTIVTREDL
jgi:hypothetical protein